MLFILLCYGILMENSKKFLESIKRVAYEPHIPFSFEEENIYGEHKRMFIRAFGINKGTVHWLFIEGIESLIHGNFISAAITLLTGIEASLRTLLVAIENDKLKEWINSAPVNQNLDSWLASLAEVNLKEIEILETSYQRQPNLNVDLLKKAYKYSLPIQELSFDGEDIIQKIISCKRPKIVEYRNWLSHGNLAQFSQKLYIDPATGEYTDNAIGEAKTAIFTSECLREISLNIVKIAVNWAKALPDYYDKN